MLAGFISAVENWENFSIEWSKVLNKTPCLEYFKMNEAESLKKQFSPKQGWTPSLRNERLSEMVDIIMSHAIVRVDCALLREDFDRIIKPPFKFPELKDPYFLCFYQLILSITKFQRQYGWRTQCHFIFDEQVHIKKHVISCRE